MSRLLREFVPAADEVSHLQTVKNFEGELFRRIAEQGHYGGRTKPTNTRQGIYAAAPSGEFLGSVNSNDPAKMRAMLEKALAKWKELPREKRLLAEVPRERGWRWETLCPGDGLVLRVHARDLPRGDAPADWRAAAWNRDFAWFRKDELAALTEPEVPRRLVVRLARLHLVDFVRGQTVPFEEKHVEKAELRCEKAEGEFRYRGEVRLSAEGKWPVRGFADMNGPGEQKRGYEARLLGRAKVENGRFVAFELVAVGTRWGGTQYNGRGDDLGRAPMGHVLTLAEPGERIPPAFVWAYGWK